MGRRVLCCGTFDCLHPGHESFLEQAAGMGTDLFVVVARDQNVLRFKGRRPSQSEDERMSRIARLPCVSDVRLGNVGDDLLRVVKDIAPDVIALGYDQVAPTKLSASFPQCEIAVMQPYHPDKYKSSLFRRVADRKKADGDTIRDTPAPSDAPPEASPRAT